MTVFEMLNTLVIGPIKLLFEVIFGFSLKLTNNPGLSIVFLSLAINILVLPLYMRADVMQKRAREKEQKLRKGIDHIKKNFSGDERMMILQTYYRQNDYSPFSAIQGSVSLLLQIPFFMAAVQVLSNIPQLKNISFGPFANLGAPDALLVIGGMTFNVLPILMTVINFISSALFSKGGSLKEKIQLYGLAIFFLVFLYNYPSGLVFYWLLNNVFSLIKTIFYKLKNPKKVLRILLSVVGLFTMAIVPVNPLDSLAKNIFVISMGLVMQIPLCYSFVCKKICFKSKEPVPNGKVFTLGTIFLTLFLGLFIPSTIISASPQEFVFAGYFFHPIWYVVSALCLAAGTFLVWFRVFYWLANDKFKCIFGKVVWVLCGTAIVNYMFFGTDFGNISSIMKFDENPFESISLISLGINLLVVAAVVFVMWILTNKKIVPYALVTVAVVMVVISTRNSFTINKSISRMHRNDPDVEQAFTLSKTGQNVVVLMVDRAMGSYIPYIMAEKPELMEKFSGFTYYDNTISYGMHTNFAFPALAGGYEYTPVELNKRDTEPLASKHNEAHLVMPTVFSDNGFEATVINPVYINYSWSTNVSFFNDNTPIRAFSTSDIGVDVDYSKYCTEINKRNLFFFSVMKSCPLVVQSSLYDNGNYVQRSYTSKNALKYMNQNNIDDESQVMGSSSEFIHEYKVLESLSGMTKLSDDKKNTFMFMNSNSTHNPTTLQLPDYVPKSVVDNTDYLHMNTDKHDSTGENTMRIKNGWQAAHYHVNMATLIKIGEWLDYLKESGVYDNTRIILVSDHGYYLNQFDGWSVKGNNAVVDLQSINPLLMVKDFNAETFNTSSEFMTNADVPNLAFEGLIENPVNPFTNKPIDDSEKYAHDQFITQIGTEGKLWDVGNNNGNEFKPMRWLSIKDSIKNTDNIEVYDKKIILKEHEFPEE